jgi:hypothetical protein
LWSKKNQTSYRNDLLLERKKIKSTASNG